ncbi:hypothetical protein N7474_002627 [Penicillium riverlandense]|uniref:uncharacterized protein n=1 Tax=Penicillium riverlandense TaxID=1903569 RepID=UPI00254664B0|nr:uncharacterized protein N7474_002627 [Penicillium riverlandense]KAJ5825489.1 hypothetical protein N7474_002627 [Penicillium riverlandense]
MSALKFKLEPDGLGRPLDQPSEIKEPSLAQTYDAFQIFNEYLQPDTKTSHDSAVESLLALVPKADNDQEVMTIINVVLELAEQIPYYHPSHIKLARIMEEFSCHSRFTWKLLDDEFAFVEYYLLEVMHQRVGPSEEDPQAWPNFNAFLAHAQSRGVGPKEPEWALETLRDTFERGIDPSNFRDFSNFEGERDQEIIAAAQYILWDGQSMFKRCLCPVPGDMGHDSYNRLRDGYYMFSLGRWRRWKNGFKKNAEEENGVGEECRKVCAKTAALMETMEASMRF